MTRRLIVAAALPLAAMVACVLAPPAYAHATSLKTTPKKDAALTKPTGAVTLTFDEAVHSSFASVVVTDPRPIRRSSNATGCTGWRTRGDRDRRGRRLLGKATPTSLISSRPAVRRCRAGCPGGTWSPRSPVPCSLS